MITMATTFLDILDLSNMELLYKQALSYHHLKAGDQTGKGEAEGTSFSQHTRQLPSRYTRQLPSRYTRQLPSRHIKVPLQSQAVSNLRQIPVMWQRIH